MQVHYVVQFQAWSGRAHRVYERVIAWVVPTGWRAVGTFETSQIHKANFYVS